MTDAMAAIGARLADCEPCLASAVDRMTWRDPFIPMARAASLPIELGEGFTPTPTTTAFSKTIPRYEHEEAYLFVAYLEEDELHDFISDLVDIWAFAIPRLIQNAHGRTAGSLDSLIIDLTPSRPPFYVAAHTGFVPVPGGSFPALTINSRDLTGTIDDLAERCGFPLYIWNTLPGITPWIVQQHPKTHRPLGSTQLGQGHAPPHRGVPRAPSRRQQPMDSGGTPHRFGPGPGPVAPRGRLHQGIG
ncbi:hypothetical protein [Streptomyces viridochromogenes]|uniref:hypothetical protein n=1 Tax=Streptomyces viridochromogenes TaxID=1938 RepID=UPI00131A2849|nr:hypothetical protein [Streptomyces viridochromogenes]